MNQRMNVAIILGKMADREFAQACYAVGIEEPELVKSPLDTLTALQPPRILTKRRLILRAA